MYLSVLAAPPHYCESRVVHQLIILLDSVTVAHVVVLAIV